MIHWLRHPVRSWRIRRAQKEYGYIKALWALAAKQ